MAVSILLDGVDEYIRMQSKSITDSEETVGR